MKNLLKYMKRYRKEAILGPLFKLSEALFELFIPLVVADIIDKGIANGDRSYIISRSILMVSLGIVGFICALIAQYFAAKTAVGVSCDLRSALYKKINSFTFTDLDSIGTSTLITRLTGDINQVQTGVNIALRLLLRSPFIVFGAMIMAFTVDVKSALIFVAAIPVLTVIVVAVMYVTVPLYKKVQTKADKLTLNTRESLKGVRVIRAFRQENKEISEFEETNQSLTVLQRLVGKISALMNPLTYIVVNAAVIAIIYVGGQRVYNGTLTQGQIVALYNYMSQILVELVKLANMIMTVNKALASSSRIDAVLDRECFTDYLQASVNITSNSAVEFKNVSFKYNGAGETSLNDLSFTAEKGQRIGIIGATGSGKSTLVNLIPAFYGATDGTVLVDGKDVKAYDSEALRRKIGIVPQKSVLFKGTVRDNLLLGGKQIADNELWSALKSAQAEETVTAKGGLDAEIEQNGRNLSGGQKQRLCIARALVGNPEILILDDSASALDFKTEAELRKALASLPQKPTVFIVSQRVSSIMNCDKIICLEDGEAVGIGTHEQLLKVSEVYAGICHSQLEKEEA